MGNDVSTSSRKNKSRHKGSDVGTEGAKATAPSKKKDHRVQIVSIDSAEETKKPPIVQLQPSVQTFADPSKSKLQKARDDKKGDTMITDALSDVRVNYHIQPKELGHGHYGVVRKCMHRETKQWYAIKSIRKSKVGKIEVLKREIEILKSVDHPHIIKLIEVHEDSKYLHLVTELCTGGELFDRIIAKTQSDEGHFSEHNAASLVRDITDAIAYCHDVKHIVHRDLKPENFLFLTEAEDAPVKIIDFGLSRYENPGNAIMKTKVGTPYYVSPEVLNREYTKACDMWSIGVITYILLCGYPPFYGDSDQQIFESVRVGRFDFPSPDWDDISDEAKDFIKALLRKDPSKRMTAAQALRHPWIRNQLEDDMDLVMKRPSLLHASNRSVTFQKFMSMQKLKKAALADIATHLTQSEVGSLGDIFGDIDKNNDGIITLKDLDSALANGNYPEQLQEDLTDLREELQLTGEDTLNWKDFLAATMDKSLALREDKIRMAFDHFNKSGGNCLQVSDLVDLFGGESQAREIMGFIDSDGDNQITFEDFRKAIAESMEDDF